MNSEASITRIRLCLLEDSASDARLIQYNLQKTFGSALHLEMFPRLEALLQYLASEPDVDLIISDLGLPDSNGLETVERLVERVPDVPIVVMTGSADEEQALEAINIGAQDYLYKDHMDRRLLGRIIRYAIERNKLVRRVRESETQVRSIVATTLDGMLILTGGGEAAFANPVAEELTELLGRERLMDRLSDPASLTEGQTLPVSGGDGPERRIEIRVVPTRWEGEAAWLVILRDMTLREQAEENRRRAENLQDIQDLAGAIAHEFSQPLQILNHTLEFLEKEVGMQPRIATCKRMSNRIIDLVCHLRNLVVIEKQPYLKDQILDLVASSRHRPDSEADAPEWRDERNGRPEPTKSGAFKPNSATEVAHGQFADR